jgi:hypothetical protein
MVSNSLNMELQELLDVLANVRREFGHDVEYQEFRRAFPAEWPL